MENNKLRKGELLNRMLVLATNSHANQFDKAGNPYILHPIAVMEFLKTDDDEELQCIALGHDIVEDCGVTYKQLLEQFTPRIVDGIRCLTKVPGESYEEYKDKVKSNPDSVRVKMCDLKHNTDITRLKGVTPKDIARMERYFKFYMELIQLNNKQEMP